MSSFFGMRSLDHYPWSMLNFKAGESIKAGVQQQWRNLLQQNHQSQVYQQFLARYAFLMLRKISEPDNALFIIDLTLKNLSIDLVVAIDNYTSGINYYCMKIGTPQQPLFTGKGTLTNTTAQALAEIQQWSDIIQQEPAIRDDVFATERNSQFFYWIISGTNDHFEPKFQPDYISNNTYVTMKPFNYLTQLLDKRKFYNLITSGSAQWEDRPLKVRNRLSNPFFTALSTRSWHNLIHQRPFSHRHLFADNASELLNTLQSNELLDEFLHIWHHLPKNRRKLYTSPDNPFYED